MEIKRGDKWSRNSYGEIEDINGATVFIKNEDGVQWSISKDIFLKEFNVASSTNSNVTISQTDIISVILAKPGVVMTVNFNKKVDEKRVKDLIDLYIAKADGNGYNSTKELAKGILEGEVRTIIGRHYHHIDDMGRLQFIDMELTKEIKTAGDGSTYDTRLRKVDPRTINWVIVENVKYTVK